MAQKRDTSEVKKALQEQREAVDKANAEAMERMDTSTPTPTQEENDLARLGIAVEEKQNDGSGETIITRTVVANQPLPAYGYSTRAAKPKE